MEFKISKVQILSAVLTDCCCFSDQQWLLESMSKHLSHIHLNSSQIFIPENPGVEWSNLVGLKSLDQTPNSLCTFYFYEIDPSLCTFLLLGNKSCKFVVLLHSRKCTWLTFFQTTFPAFPTNQSIYAKFRIKVFSIWNHIRPLNHALLNLVVNQTDSILACSDEPKKIKDLTKSKKFWGKLLHKISFIILA